MTTWYEEVKHNSQLTSIQCFPNMSPWKLLEVTVW